MKLIILESPNKCHTVSKIMGSNFKVLATAGHIMHIDSLYAYRTGIDIANNFTPAYIFDTDKKDILKKIKDAAKTADEIFVCSDGDREGEVIAHEIRELLKTHKKKLRRAVFNEITDKVVKNAIANPIPFNEEMIEAGISRATIDRLVGYRISPIALSKLNCESAGRVQSALLRLVCDKEHQIQAFKSAKYWEVFLDFKKGSKLLTAKLKEFNGKKVDRFKSQTDAAAAIADCTEGNYIVDNIKEKERLVDPKLPFTTSTMQQAASSQCGMSPSKSMSAAQHLFEKGYITYHRTDAIRFSDEFIVDAKASIEKNYGKEYYRGLVVSKKENENAQNGHESVRPTDILNTPSKMSQILSGDELKLYKLIYNRSLAALFVPAKVKDTEITISNNKCKFGISGKTVVFESFLALYNDEDDDEKKLPTFKKDEKVVEKNLYSEEKTTQPPQRYSEAGLVKLMETTGIGRPSSYSGTIETLKKREYITIEKKAVYATEKGIKLDNMLKEFFPTIINIEYTSQMETSLDEIACGTKTRVETMSSFWTEFEPLVLKAAREINKNKEKPKSAGRKCPKCGKELIIRKSKYGTEFICCSGFPKCKHTESLTNTDSSDAIKCPDCGDGVMVERVAKKTKEVFYGCSRYPNCKRTMNKAQMAEYKATLASSIDGSADRE